MSLSLLTETGGKVTIQLAVFKKNPIFEVQQYLDWNSGPTLTQCEVSKAHPGLFFNII